jgi:hypothetical protein
MVLGLELRASRLLAKTVFLKKEKKKKNLPEFPDLANPKPS